jgi:hypothetical protein
MSNQKFEYRCAKCFFLGVPCVGRLNGCGCECHRPALQTSSLSGYLTRTAIACLLLGIAAQGQCGVERNAVKDLKDPAAKEIHFAVKSNTIALLRKVKAPNDGKIGNTLARQDGEKQVYELQADLIGYKYEADGDRDYHVVLSTPGKPAETMIVEIPHPDCAPAPYKQVFAAERAFVDGLALAVSPRHKPGPTFYQFPQPIPVTAVGVTFFDKVHGTHKNLDGTVGQVGVAPNGIELHPALKLSKR